MVKAVVDVVSGRWQVIRALLLVEFDSTRGLGDP
jgi:hypothetical protein